MMTQPRELSLTSGTIVQSLNGQWQLAADPDDAGMKQAWFKSQVPATVSCPVPGIIQQALPDCHGVVWYYMTFTPAENPHQQGRYLLRFGAVDNESIVWINGREVGGFNNPETPFTLDITDALKLNASNLVAVRVLNPVGEARAQRPNRNKSDSIECAPGASFNYGGIIGNVELLLVPAVYIEDVFVKADAKTQTLTITTTVRNTLGAATDVALEFDVAPAAQGGTRETVQLDHELAVGSSTLSTQITIANPRLWSLDDPYLYRVTARVSATESTKAVHTLSVRCGFRDFRVVDGFFTLNGKRLFLKSTHTGNHLPGGQVAPPDHEFLRRDMIYAKASGFNMVRFISGVACPEQLDFCDELGLMVYEECNAGWCLQDSPQMKERFDRGVREMVKRDRNHPSVTIWGMLNETPAGAVFDQAVAALTVVREQDDSRLVLLSSGRWDGRQDIGSVCNPGSQSWEHAWGLEAPNALPLPANLTWCDYDSKVAGYAQQAGDCHVYTRVPQAPFATKFVRTVGAETKPMFLSEYGIGSLQNSIHELRHFEQAGLNPALKDFALNRSMTEKFLNDWSRWGFDTVYPFPEDLFLESQRLHSRQRAFTFDCLRSNSKFCGYNLTGMLDHAITGEGLWTFWRRWKQGTFDAVSDGWAPLRWCLFVEPMHVYTDRPFKIEAVLANEDVLKPGDYPVQLRIFGPAGLAWEHSSVLKITSSALAVPVLAQEITISGPPGEYTFAANIERGAAPAGGRLTFHVSDSAALPKLNECVSTWGIDEASVTWLSRHGVTCTPLKLDGINAPEIVLVGNHFKTPPDAAEWMKFARQIARGSTAVFLRPQVLTRGEKKTGWLPLKEQGTCIEYNDWLYHKECVSKRHAVFSGLDGPGVMDWEYYNALISREIFQHQSAPDEVYAAAFATGACGQPNVSGGYVSGTLLSSHRLGHGRILLNTLRILETLDANPAADRLLLNVIQEARRITAAGSGEIAAETEALLKSVYA